MGSCYVPRLSQSRPKSKKGDFLGRQTDHRDISRLRVSLPSHEACGLPALYNTGSNRTVSLTPHNNWEPVSAMYKTHEEQLAFERTNIVTVVRGHPCLLLLSGIFLPRCSASECALFVEVSLSPHCLIGPVKFSSSTLQMQSRVSRATGSLRHGSSG